MTGALGLKGGLQGYILLNLDTEDDDEYPLAVPVELMSPRPDLTKLKPFRTASSNCASD